MLYSLEMPKLEDYSLSQIRKLVSNINKKVKISGYSKMKKDKLIKTLREHERLTVNEGGAVVSIKLKSVKEKMPSKVEAKPTPKPKPKKEEEVKDVLLGLTEEEAKYLLGLAKDPREKEQIENALKRVNLPKRNKGKKQKNPVNKKQIEKQKKDLFKILNDNTNRFEGQLNKLVEPYINYNIRPATKKIVDDIKKDIINLLKKYDVKPKKGKDLKDLIDFEKLNKNNKYILTITFEDKVKSAPFIPEFIESKPFTYKTPEEEEKTRKIREEFFSLY